MAVLPTAIGPSVACGSGSPAAMHTTIPASELKYTMHLDSLRAVGFSVHAKTLS